MAVDIPHSGFEEYVGEPVPQAAPGSPGKDGRLELAFERQDGKTRLVRDFARAPFHISGTLDHDPIDAATTVLIQSPSGGIAQGDRREERIRVGSNAIAHIGTGSSTKVFSMECNYASADISMSVDSGGHLEYLPEPIILHPDARFCQSLSLSVDRDATAIVGDVVVPGRLARGETFAFERYAGRTEISGPNGLLAADAVRLEPATRSPQVPGVIGDSAVHGTLFVVAPAADSTALSDAIHEAVSVDTVASPESDEPASDGVDGGTVSTSLGDDRSSAASSEAVSDAATETREAEAGATALPNEAGVLVRAVGETTEPVRELLRAGWQVARRELLDAPTPQRRT